MTKLERLKRNCDTLRPTICRPWVVRLNGADWTIASTMYCLAMMRGRLVTNGPRRGTERTVLIAKNREVRGMLAAPLLRGIRCDARKLLEFLREPRTRVESGCEPVMAEPVIVNGAIVNRLILLRALRAVGCGVSSGRIRVAAAERWIHASDGRKTRQHLCVFGDGWAVIAMPMVRSPKGMERFR